MSLVDGTRPPEILLVEDSASDVRLAQEAFKEKVRVHHLHVARDGDVAVAFLRREGKFHEAPRPDLVLLDLNLPKKDGRQVLAEIKANDALRLIPICVLTTSTDPQDIAAAYRLGANCYVAKQMDMAAFVAQIHAIYDFWFGTVRLPESDE